MPASDILNPTAYWDENIQDSMCPNYGFTRKRASTQLHKKAVGGTPWTRETQNTGHVFTFSWLGRTWACVQRLKQYYEQYEDGFFTIVDWDGGGRQYVGRFTSEVSPVETGNGMWDVQNVTFEEMPQVAMIDYPDDWDHDSMLYLPFNDFGDQKLATSGAWTVGTATVPTVTLGGIARASLANNVFTNPGTNTVDWATFEYRGYGFQLYLVTGPAMGICSVNLDGVLVETVDCYAATAAAATMVLSNQDVPLDIHDVQVVVTNTKNAASTATAISWWALQVMR